MDAADELVERNLPFVITICNQLGVSPLHPEYEDCLLVGSQGLIVAARRFKVSRGANYATYAAWWVKQAIKRHLHNHQNTIRYPVHVGQEKSRLTRVASALEQELGRRPTPKEISFRSGIDLERMLELFGLPTTSPLDKPLGEDGEETMHGLIADNDTVPADVAAANHDDYIEAVRKVRELITVAGTMSGKTEVNERNRMIFCQRYGLDGYGPPRSLELVGSFYRITRERVRQICDSVFRYTTRAYVKVRFPDIITTENELLATIDFILQVGEMLWTNEGRKPKDFDLVSVKETAPDPVTEPMTETSERVELILEALLPAFADEGLDIDTLCSSDEYPDHSDALLYALTCDLGIPATDLKVLPAKQTARVETLLSRKLGDKAASLIENLRNEYTLSMWGKPSIIMERQTSLHGKQRAELEALLSHPNGHPQDEIKIARALLEETTSR
jgi:RNA polymerase sigma factor (sigma-70 family)